MNDFKILIQKIGMAVLLCAMLFSCVANAETESSSVSVLSESLHSQESEAYIHQLIEKPLKQELSNKPYQQVSWNDVIAESNTGFWGHPSHRLYENLTAFLKLAEAQINEEISSVNFQEKAELFRVQLRLFEAGKSDIFPVQQLKVEVLQAHQLYLKAHQNYMAAQSEFKADIQFHHGDLSDADLFVADLTVFQSPDPWLAGWMVQLPSEKKLVYRAVRKNTSWLGRILNDAKATQISQQTRQAYYAYQGLIDVVEDGTVQTEVAIHTVVQKQASVKAGSSSQSSLTLTQLGEQQVNLHQQLNVLHLAANQLGLLYASGNLSAKTVFIYPYQH